MPPRMSTPAFRYASHLRRHCINHVFVCRITDAEAKSIVAALTVDSQHQGIKWFSVDDPSIHPLMKIKITKAERALDAHDAGSG